MEQGQTEQIEALLGCLSVGIAVLDSTDLRIRYLNAYLRTQLEKHWHIKDGTGQRVDELLPEEVRKIVLTRLHTVALTGEGINCAELPYEGFLQTRGRTYWRVTVKKAYETLGHLDTLLVMVEDITETVRSRIHLHAIKYISSAIAEAYALPLVLDRILHSVREMIGATRCAILLIEHGPSEYNEAGHTLPETIRRATIAAQHGVLSQDWHPILSERLLLSRVEQERRTLVITDTTLTDLDLPFLDDSGTPRLPGSVLCIPIFGPHVSRESFAKRFVVSEERVPKKVVLGSIEVYHRRARGFAAEEIEQLEQFTQQAGLAIQNARLFRNVNQLARAERRSAHQRAYMMQAMPDGVIIFDPRWRVAETNQAIRTLLGWTNDILGQTVTQALQQSKAILYYDITHLTDPIPELERRAHAGLIDEFKMIGADDHAYTIRCTYTPIRDDLGDTFAFVVIFHDATEQTAIRERIKAEVRERTKELAQRNEALQLAHVAQENDIKKIKMLERAREDFFTIMAHELKTPLANIRAHLSALLINDVQWSMKEQHASLQTANEQVERLVSMVNSVLHASRIEAGALHLTLGAVLLPELFEDLEERLQALIMSSRRLLRIVYPENLPAVRADYESIISVLTNLLSNAFRYAPEDDRVLLEAEPVFDTQDTQHIDPIGVLLSVSDRGQGIAQEQQKKLFTRFSTFAATSRPENGHAEQPDRKQRQGTVHWSPTTGLGLYISRGIVEAHESRLLLKSNPGQGTRFSFILPAFKNMQESINE